MNAGNWIAIAGVFATVTVNFLIQTQKGRKEAEIRGREMGGITTQLGNIQADVQEIKADQKITASTMVDLVGRMAIVERDIEKAHKRIDRLKGKSPVDDND